MANPPFQAGMLDPILVRSQNDVRYAQIGVGPIANRPLIPDPTNTWWFDSVTPGLIYYFNGNGWNILIISAGAGGGNLTTLGLYANLPAVGATNGDTYQCLDGPYKFVWTGTLWQAFYGNQAVGVPGPSSGWSQINFGGKITLSDAAGVIGMNIADTTAANWRLITKPTPVTPYHIETFIRASLINVNSDTVGAYFYDGTKLVGVECLAQATGPILRVQKATNVTTAGATPFSTGSNVLAGAEFGGIWIRLGNNGTNLTFDWALERGDWVNLFTEAVGTFITPNAYGVGGICVTGIVTNNLRLQFLANTVTP